MAVSRSWCFTLNKYTTDEKDTIKSWTDDVTRMIVSKEVGAKGTKHLQGQITFKRCYRLSALKKLLTRAHWEPTKAKADMLYVLKDSSRMWLNIDNRQQGKRSDLDEVVDKLKNERIDTIWRDHTKVMIKYHKGIELAHAKLNPKTCKKRFKLSDFKWKPITDWTSSHIIIGESGIGKTEFAKAHFERPLIVSHIDDLKNLTDNYDGIIFDDMDFTHWPRNAQIHITDIDEDRSINVKYGTVTIPADTKKIFTCNVMCLDVADGAIRRRVTVTEVEKGNTILSPTSNVTKIPKLILLDD